ncbi:MAG: phosphoglucosamine mutase [Bacteroidota bacterium]
MTLIKSISGIRGTIGGKPNEGLTPVDIVKFSAAFGTWAKEKSGKSTIIIGRDARVSGEMVSKLVSSTLQALGLDVIDLGLSTTPTVEMFVPKNEAAGGIILTASHNPAQWNALKLLNEKGEFISGANGQEVLQIAENDDFLFSEVKELGEITIDDSALEYHINAILELPMVDVESIRAKGFKVVLDAVNSSGGIAIPKLLEKLSVEVKKLYCEPTGIFPHNPEPLPENITEICNEVKHGRYDLGIIVDPDVDRLALVSEDGSPFGEEYTLVAVADYILKNTKGNTVSNLSSTRALRDVTEKHGGAYSSAAVGEVNVVEEMKASKAIIGGEGNGGIIYPELHYGRDALVGIALFLSHLAKSDITASKLRASYPEYHISKNKIELNDGIDVDSVLKSIKHQYHNHPVNTVDGVKIEFENEWVHLRKSNTEPIIRIYSEADSESKAESLAKKLISDIKEIMHEAQS